METFCYEFFTQGQEAMTARTGRAFSVEVSFAMAGESTGLDL